MISRRLLEAQDTYRATLGNNLRENGELGKQAIIPKL